MRLEIIKGGRDKLHLSDLLVKLGGVQMDDDDVGDDSGDDVGGDEEF